MRAFARRTRILVSSVVVILLSLAALGLQYVLAPPASDGVPVRLSDFGVVRVYASVQFLGNAKIKIVATGLGPFFIAKILVILNKPADADIVLDSISIDGTTSIPVSSGFPGANRVVIVAAGAVVGEIVGSLPDYLNILLTKDPLGNDAFAASCGEGNGMLLSVRYFSGTYYPGATISAIALVTAPANATVTMTIA
jgi:hypothetical protein